MDTAKTISETNKIIKDQGISTVLVVFLMAVLGYLGYKQTEQLNQQINTWQTLRSEDLGALRKDLDAERLFIRGELLTTIEDNQKATKSHTEAIKELTQNLRMSRGSN